MTEKPLMYFAGGCVLMVALVLVLLGLIFMIGCQGRIGTALTGVVMLVLGLGGGIFALRKLGQLLASTPQRIDERMLKLAAMSGGEITLAEATGSLNLRLEEAQASLQRLVEQGLADQRVRNGDTYYVFPGLVEVRKVKRCSYCGNEYALRDPRRTCPSCGGNLEIVDAVN